MTQLFMIHPSLERPSQSDKSDVRKATPEDANALARLLVDSFQEAWDLERVNRVLLEAADVHATYVIEENGEIIATASARYPTEYPEAGYVHYVGVLPSTAGRGLGRRITSRVLRDFMDSGLTQGVLETDDFRLPAIVTYFRLGFIPEYRNPEEKIAWSAVLRTLFPIAKGANA